MPFPLLWTSGKHCYSTELKMILLQSYLPLRLLYIGKEKLIAWSRNMWQTLFKKKSLFAILLHQERKKQNIFFLQFFTQCYISFQLPSILRKNIHEYKWGRIYFKYLILCLCNKSNVEHISVSEIYSAKFEDTN